MVSDPTTQHSDTDEADDFIEKKSGTNPLVFDHFREVDVNALTNDDLYYYEDFVEDVYDGSVVHQISAAFLCVITTSWNPVGECREFLTNYLDKYGETNVEVAEVSANEEMKMWINNLDRLAGFVEKLVTANDHGVKLFTIKKTQSLRTISNHISIISFNTSWLTIQYNYPTSSPNLSRSLCMHLRAQDTFSRNKC